MMAEVYKNRNIYFIPVIDWFIQYLECLLHTVDIVIQYLECLLHIVDENK